MTAVTGGADLFAPWVATELTQIAREIATRGSGEPAGGCACCAMKRRLGSLAATGLPVRSRPCLTFRSGRGPHWTFASLARRTLFRYILWSLRLIAFAVLLLRRHCTADAKIRNRPPDTPAYPIGVAAH